MAVGRLVAVVGGAVREDEVESHLEVALVDRAGEVRLEPAAGKEDDASVAGEAAPAGGEQLVDGRLGLVLQGEVDAVTEHGR